MNLVPEGAAIQRVCRRQSLVLLVDVEAHVLDRQAKLVKEATVDIVAAAAVALQGTFDLFESTRREMNGRGTLNHHLTHTTHEMGNRCVCIKHQRNRHPQTK